MISEEDVAPSTKRLQRMDGGTNVAGLATFGIVLTGRLHIKNVRIHQIRHGPCGRVLLTAALPDMCRTCSAHSRSAKRFGRSAMWCVHALTALPAVMVAFVAVVLAGANSEGHPLL